MRKDLLLETIIAALEEVHQVAVNATERAHNAATDDESKAENKYDTQGIEAAYLAHGQSQRVSECKDDLAAFKKLSAQHFTDESPIAIGALIILEDSQNTHQCLFLGPAAGGLKLTFDDQPITLITASAPLGKMLLGHFVGDEISLNIAGADSHYEVVAVY